MIIFYVKNCVIKTICVENCLTMCENKNIIKMGGVTHGKTL